MERSWTSVFNGPIEGRNVNCEVHYEGGYRVRTTQLGDHAIPLQHDDDESTTNRQGTLGPQLFEDGCPIDVEGDSLVELHGELIRNDFNFKSADAIVGKYSGLPG